MASKSSKSTETIGIPLIVTSKTSDVDEFLVNLERDKEYRIVDIVATITQLPEIQGKIESGHFKFLGERYLPTEQTSNLKDLWVVLNYQRILRLRRILRNFATGGGFDRDAAGVVDVAYRPNSRKNFVWDGFRRCVMVGMANSDTILTTKFNHPPNMSEADCMKKEARLFKQRNADNEPLKPEEIFRSQICYEDPTAIHFKEEVLDTSRLDVLGLNPNGITLGGFGIVYGAYNSNEVNKENIRDASEILRDVFTTEPNISGYLLLAIAWILGLDECKYSPADIKTKLHEWYIDDSNRGINKQKNITKDGFRNYPLISWIFSKRILKDDVFGNVIRGTEKVTDKQIEAALGV